MQQLTGLDDLFLRMETEASFGHTSSLSILRPGREAPQVTLARVKEVFAQRVHLVPIFRRRVAEVPFELDHPYWVDDPEFDVDNHITRVALSKPGNQRQLQRVAAKIVAAPLDRSRPLWHTTLITGIEDGRIGLLTRIHHACVDGLGGTDILTTLMDETPSGRDFGPPPPWEPEPIPDSLALLAFAAASLTVRPLRYMELQRDVVDGLIAAVGRARGSSSMIRRALMVPPTPFNHTISSSRVWEFRRLPLDRFKLVKNVFGCTVNDVVVAVCAGALRRWLIDHDALPALPLVAAIPVSIRASDDPAFGNRVSAITSELPTHLPDPLDRLRAAHESLASGKDVQRAMPLSVMQDSARFVAPAVAELAVRQAHAVRLLDWTAEPYNVIVSNVPGPTHPLYFAGSRLEGIYPLSALADGQGLNISLLGYNDALHFGLLACPELVPDLDELADYLGAELRLLAAAASRAAAQPSASGRTKTTGGRKAVASKPRAKAATSATTRH
jgi:diacylglycerol O-acyltransferase